MKRNKALALFYAAMVSSSFAYAQETTIKVKVEDQTGLEKELPIEIKKNVPATETTVKKKRFKQEPELVRLTSLRLLNLLHL